MSKTKITLMSLILALALLIGIGCIPLFTDAAETESKIENSDFYQLGTGVSAVPSEKSTETDVILPYSGEGHLFFGESAEKAYPVDMAVFSWNIRISQLAVGQSFAVSFVKDTTKKPFEGRGRFFRVYLSERGYSAVIHRGRGGRRTHSGNGRYAVHVGL